MKLSYLSFATKKEHSMTALKAISQYLTDLELLVPRKSALDENGSER
jgi:hypothetical protein